MKTIQLEMISDWPIYRNHRTTKYFGQNEVKCDSDDDDVLLPFLLIGLLQSKLKLHTEIYKRNLFFRSFYIWRVQSAHSALHTKRASAAALLDSKIKLNLSMSKRVYFYLENEQRVVQRPT